MKIINASVLSFVAVFVVAFWFGFGAGWLTFHENASEKQNASTTQEENTQFKIDETKTQTAISAPVSLAAAFEIRVNNQLPGESVTLASLKLSKSIWIAIREDEKGSPGRILGARFFTPEDLSGTVPLLRGTTAGNSYYVFVYEDDGDREFDFKKDLPLFDPFGNMIIKKFDVVQPNSPHEFGM